MSHVLKDCLERPRKKGAKFTGKNIARDEVLHDSASGLNGLEGMGDWDAKRDRWDGYDPAQHKAVVKEYEALEEARRKLREEAIDKGSKDADEKAIKKAAKDSGKGSKKRKKDKEDEEDDFGSEDESADENGGDDEDKYAEGADVAGQRMDTKTRVTVRNLRIREDTAKYLRNLDPESAYYDPKTRSMREAPVANVRPEDAVFAGDNFARHSGGAAEVQQLQLFAWQSEQRGNDVHINSNPTQSHLLHREFLEKKDELKETSSASILQKYGGEKYLQSLPRELLGGQTEDYVEYSRTGQVVKGRERAKAKSKYEEDGEFFVRSLDSSLPTLKLTQLLTSQSFLVIITPSGVPTTPPPQAAGVSPAVVPRSSSPPLPLPLLSSFSPSTQILTSPHSHSIKASYCAGQASIDAAEAEAAGGLGLLTDKVTIAAREKTMVQLKEEEIAAGKVAARKERNEKSTIGEGDVDGRLDKRKLEDALKGRGENFGGKPVTEEEMGMFAFRILFTPLSLVWDWGGEAYRMQREQKFDDPMAKLGADELLPM
ncbi:pre-mRNA-processing factor SLU7, partial [Phenoliferia sp. Uapishka_3]